MLKSFCMQRCAHWIRALFISCTAESVWLNQPVTRQERVPPLLCPSCQACRRGHWSSCFFGSYTHRAIEQQQKLKQYLEHYLLVIWLPQCQGLRLLLISALEYSYESYLCSIYMETKTQSSWTLTELGLKSTSD